MKRLCVFFLPLLLAALLFAGILFALPDQYSATYLGALKDKADLLRQPSLSPRIILIGGSGAAFSLRSDLMEGELPGFKVIDFGLYGGLGTAPMLDLALPEIVSGDIVLIAPEQNEQTLSGYFGPRAMWQAADGRPGLLLRLSGEKLKGSIGDALPFAAEKLSFFLHGNAPRGDGVYARDHFNAWGDLIEDGREGNKMLGGYDPDMPVRFDRDMLSPGFVREMNAFADTCRRKGAKVYYLFGPMTAAAVSAAERENAAAFAAYLASQLVFPVLGVPDDSILDSVWFFDTNFHLNAAGAVVYTARLAERIKKELGLPVSVSIDLPDPPSGLDERSDAVSGPDAEFFLYEERNGEAYLTALTPEGKIKTHLQIPGEMDGLPVTAFSPALFSGNTVVEEIVLPASVRRVENGSFTGCAALQDLVLLQQSPSRCSVGEGLLDGTDALIRVPAAAYSLYQTSYFWSVHAARIRPAGEVEELPSSPPAEEQTASHFRIADANGGLKVDGTGTSVSFPVSSSHLRTNTPLGQNLFRRDGHVPLCWNTSPDGTGEDIPFGSRTDSEDGKTLYMKWLLETPETDLIWEEKNGEAWVTGRTGSGSVLALPEKLGGLPVRRIVKDAFKGSQIITAVLPPTLFAVEQGAFAESGLKEIWLYDSLYYVYEESFSGCPDLQTLHIGAATSPRYSVSYFGAFADKLDWLRLHSEVPKIVLAGGSATRYAYDSEMLEAAFPSYTPVNMGVYAYTNMLPQYRLMERFMGPGDILISAPEFDTVKTQFCVSDALDERFWNMAEADWACVSLLDLREYSQVFSSLSDFLHARRMMTAHRYEETPPV